MNIIVEYKSVYSNQVTMADMIVLFVALVNVGKFFFLAVNPYFNQVVFSRSLCVNNIIEKNVYAITKSNYSRYNRFVCLGSC